MNSAIEETEEIARRIVELKLEHGDLAWPSTRSSKRLSMTNFN